VLPQGIALMRFTRRVGLISRGLVFANLQARMHLRNHVAVRQHTSVLSSADEGRRGSLSENDPP